MDNFDVIVIGAGAAGMMAAGKCGERGFKTLLFEKKDNPGRKLMITGKGRCNVTNNCSEDELVSSTVTNGKFLYSAFSRFNSQDTMKFFEELGVKLKTERGNRVFPVSDKSCDIVDALKRYISKNKVVLLNKKVVKLIIEEGFIKGVTDEEGKEYFARNVIVATGGRSYSMTGSTGDGYKFAKAAGHSIVPVKPSLVPLTSLDPECKEMQGLSLKNVALKVYDKQKNTYIYEDFGEMLFTHFGISGPLVLSAGSHIRNIEPKRYVFEIDLKSALSEEKLEARLMREFSENANKDISNCMVSLLPKSMIEPFLRRCSVNKNVKCNSVTKEERKKILSTLKKFTVEIEGTRPIEEAIITSGGVNVKEINAKTMESKKCNGLYFAGEVIDVDAYTGGFNLQIAFSTAVSAAESLI